MLRLQQTPQIFQRRSPTRSIPENKDFTMPTGYTHAIGTGEITTLKQFALQCARGMGACITMRDDPWDAPLPERFEPQTKYYEEKLAAAKALLAELDNLTLAECQARAKTDYAARLERHEQYRREREAENGRYEAMLSQVRSWHTEAEGIREFMIDQLQISIIPHSSPPPLELSGEEWLREERLSAMHDIAYYEKAIADEIHRVAGRNIWLAALRRSLSDAIEPTGGDHG
jgi:hypothetical protein